MFVPLSTIFSAVLLSFDKSLMFSFSAGSGRFSVSVCKLWAIFKPNCKTCNVLRYPLRSQLGVCSAI